MQNNSELEQIEVTIEEAEANINKLEALQRLRKNSDFKLLVEDGYLKDEASRLVLTLADPAVQGEEQQAVLHKMINGVGYFRQYLHRIYQFGYQAQRSIEDHRNTRNEIMDEA